MTENKTWLEDKYVQQWFRNLAERTQKNYSEQFPKFLEFVNKTPTEIIESRLQHLKSDDPRTKRFWEDMLVKFKISLEGKDMKIPTVRAYLRTVMSFFSQNHVGLVFARKELKVEPSAKDRVIKEWIPDREEIRILYRTAENSRDRSILLTLYQSGFSEIDVANMKIEQFPFYDSNGNWQLKEEDLYHARLREKTNELQQTCISREAIEEIRVMLQARGFPKEGYLFVSFRDQQLGVRGINEAMKSIVEKAFVERAKEWKTKYLRDAHMNALQQAKIPTELKDSMVGHKRSGAKASYGITEQTIKTLYAECFQYLTVNGFAAGNRKIEDLEFKMNQQNIAIEQKSIEIEALKRILEYAMPKDKLKEALLSVAHEHGITLPVNESLSDLLKEIAKKPKSN